MWARGSTLLVGPGVVAAGRDSDLARPVGIFAFVGNYATSTFRSDAAGDLLLGQHNNYDTYCLSGFQVQWAETTYTFVTSNYWVVPGSVVSSSQTSRNKLLNAVEWKIDTGAAHIYLPSSIYSHVLESIRIQGMKSMIQIIPRILQPRNVMIIPFTPGRAWNSPSELLL